MMPTVGNGEVQSILNNLTALTDSEVLALRPTRAMVERLESLLEKNKTTGWSPAEESEWEQYQYLEHQVRLAKASAARKVKEANGE